MPASAAEILKRLIRVPSVNPAFGAPPEFSNEFRMADAVAAELTPLGFRCELRPCPSRERPALTARFGPDAPSRTLMFGIHLDTVGIAGMSIPPFTPSERDGRIYGRGACDMKGAMAALFAALTRELLDRLAARGLQVMVVGTPDEECGTRGATELARRGLRADACVVLEPTENQPVIAHKGCRWYELILHGRAGHGSAPERAVSTNAALARLLPELLRGHKALQGMHQHPLLQSSTLNIGRVEGGSAYNIVPDLTRVHLDRRCIPNEDPLLFEHMLDHMLDDLRAEGVLLSGEWSLTSHTPAFATPEDAPLVRRLSLAVEEVSQVPALCQGTSWVSDAAPFSTVCGETVVFGPGSITQAHTADEYIALDELDKGRRVFDAFLRSLADAP